MFLITIKPEHTAGKTFHYRKPGALVAAARQQCPELGINEENSCYCSSNNGQRYDFKTTEYNEQLFNQLKTKQVKELKVTLEPNNIY